MKRSDYYRSQANLIPVLEVADLDLLINQYGVGRPLWLQGQSNSRDGLHVFFGATLLVYFPH